MLGTKPVQIFFLFRSKSPTGECEFEILLQFGNSFFMLMGGQSLIDNPASLGIDQFEPRLGQVTR